MQEDQQNPDSKAKGCRVDQAPGTGGDRQELHPTTHGDHQHGVQRLQYCSG